MKNRKIGIIVFLLCFCFHLMPLNAMAASTSDAAHPILPEKECSLTVSYCCGDTALPDVQVMLYRIAEVSADYRYTLTQSFEASGVILDGIQSSAEWDVARFTLESHIIGYNVAPEFTSVTNGEGKASFDSLKTGMYLAVVNQIENDGMYYLFDSALIALPGLEQDGSWQYQVSVNAKGEALPPTGSDEKTELKVLKLWRGDEGRSDRPESVEVEIFRNGSSYDTVTLSEENHWSYSWSVENDASSWTVVERNVPKGYTATVVPREATFVLTNTRIPEEDPGDPEKPPQTGDTSNILLYVLIMIGSGSMLIVVGVTGKKSRV